MWIHNHVLRDARARPRRPPPPPVGPWNCFLASSRNVLVFYTSNITRDIVRLASRRPETHAVGNKEVGQVRKRPYYQYYDLGEAHGALFTFPYS